MRLLATCKLGLESTVAGTLRQLGIESIETADARVAFSDIGELDALFVDIVSFLDLHAGVDDRHQMNAVSL